MKKFIGEMNIKSDYVSSLTSILLENGYNIEMTPKGEKVNVQIYEEMEEPKKGPFDEMDKIVEKFNKDLEEMLNDITRK